MKKRDADPVCGACRFWLPGRSESDPRLGSCKRYPPTIGPSTDRQAVPATTVADWCGEFKDIAP